MHSVSVINTPRSINQRPTPRRYGIQVLGPMLSTTFLATFLLSAAADDDDDDAPVEDAEDNTVAASANGNAFLLYIPQDH
jgi:hypothetical protein